MGDNNYSKGTRVYVGGLSDGIKKEDLETEFEKYGKLNSVWVAFNPPGFAFIEFPSKDEAETACDNLNGTELLGSKLRVEISRDRGRGRRGNFRGSRGSRGGGYSPRGGGSSGYRGSYGSSGDRGGSFRGSRGGGRGRGRYEDHGSRSSYGGRDYDRDGGRDGYSSGGRDGYGSGRDSYGGGSSSYDAGSRYRSRSPVSRGVRGPFPSTHLLRMPNKNDSMEVVESRDVTMRSVVVAPAAVMEIAESAAAASRSLMEEEAKSDTITSVVSRIQMVGITATVPKIPTPTVASKITVVSEAPVTTLAAASFLGRRSPKTVDTD